MAVSPLVQANDAAHVEEALTALYERHASRVFRFCRHWLRSREEAEDAVQSTFLNAFRGLERGIVPAHEEAWLLSIARNVCLSRTDAVRRRAVEVTRDPHTLDELVAAPAETHELEGLSEAFAALTEQQRRAIFLREWHGLSYREIAETLALSQAAVETLLFRARRTLARHVRRPLGIGSFAPWLRSLVEGAAGKVALGAAAVAVTATTGAIVITPRHQHGQAPHVSHVTPALRSAPEAPQAKPEVVSSTRPRAQAPHATPLPAAHGTAPVKQPIVDAAPAPAPTPALQSSPASPVPAAAAETPTTTTADEPTLPTALQTITADATGTVGAVATTAANTVDQVAAGAVGTVTGATTTVQATTQTVANVVTTLLGPHQRP